MADIKVRFEVNPNAESELLGDVNNVNAEISNVSVKTNSSSIFQNIPTSESSGTNGLLLSKDLVFDEQGYVDNEDLQGGVIQSEENPTEFIWGVVPESKQYSVKLTFSNAQNLKDIIIYGDKIANQFPTRAIIDGATEVFSDDYRWAINLQTESDTHTIEFTHWNRANYNACLTLIRVMMKYFEIDKRTGLKSVESLSQSTGQPKSIFYGVVPNDGSAEIADVNGEIEDMIKDGAIPNSNVKIEIYANNNKVQNHKTTNSSYNTNNKSLNIDIKNDLYYWDNISYSGYKLNNKSSLYDVLVSILYPLYNNINKIDEMLDSTIVVKENVEDTVKFYLQGIIIQHPYLQSSSVREAIDKVCSIAQLNVLQKDSGKIKFVSARPLMVKEDKIIKISNKNQMSTFKSDLILENKYESVNVQLNRTNINDFSFDSRKIQVYNYDNISVNLSDYTLVLNDNRFNDGLSVISKQVPSVNNPSNSSSGQFWYYYIAKFDISYNNTDLTLLRDFKPKMKYSITSIHPMNEKSPISKGSELSIVLDPYDSSITDNEIISEWLNANNQVKSGTPSFDFRVRKKDDSTLTVFYISLQVIIERVSSDEGVRAIYNNLDLNFFVDKVEQNLIDTQNNADITISANELLQDKTKLNEEIISNVIKNNILNDYHNGIRNGELSIICSDYYDIDNNLIKNWSNGEILQVGDIVRIDKNNDGISAMKYADGSDMYFRVTGRRFRYAGVPLIDLELQEVKVAY